MRTITAQADVDSIFTSGRRSSARFVTLIVVPTPPSRGPLGRVMFVAGQRLGGAVWRNRAKRVMRDAMRRAGGPWDGYDVALVAKRETGQVSARELDASLDQALRRSGVVQ
jgi:ribonuclease P protein component